MTKLAIELTNEQATRLSHEAERLGVPTTELAKAAIASLLSQPDDEFTEVAERVLEKNRDLYERLG
jgi:hypothetical protein